MVVKSSLKELMYRVRNRLGRLTGACFLKRLDLGF